MLRGEEAGHFREVAGVSIVAAGGPQSAFVVDTLTVDTLTVDSQVTYINI